MISLFRRSRAIRAQSVSVFGRGGIQGRAKILRAAFPICRTWYSIPDQVPPHFSSAHRSGEIHEPRTGTIPSKTEHVHPQTKGAAPCSQSGCGNLAQCQSECGHYLQSWETVVDLGRPACFYSWTREASPGIGREGPAPEFGTQTPNPKPWRPRKRAVVRCIRSARRLFGARFMDSG